MTSGPRRTVGITGSAGFLGLALTRQLSEAGFQVVAFVRASTQIRALAKTAAKICQLGPEGSWRDACGEVDILIHAATNYGRQRTPSAHIVRDNVLLPLEVLEHLNPTAAFLNTDTFFTKPGTKNAYLAKYGLSKLQLLEWLNQEEQRTMANVRLEHVFGPSDRPDKFIPATLARLCEGERNIQLSDGLQTRDFVFIDDVVSAYLAIIKNVGTMGAGVHEFEVGRGEAVSVRSFVELMKDVSDSPSQLNFGELPRREGELSASTANLAALEDLGWSPKCSLREGLESCLSAYRVEQQAL